MNAACLIVSVFRFNVERKGEFRCLQGKWFSSWKTLVYDSHVYAYI